MGLGSSYSLPLLVRGHFQAGESSRQKVMGGKRTARGCKQTATLPPSLQSHILQMGTIRSNYAHLGFCPSKLKFRSIDFEYSKLEEAARGSKQQLHADC